VRLERSRSGRLQLDRCIALLECTKAADLDTAYGANGLASSYAVLGLDLTYDSGRHPYFLTAYVQNLTDKAVYSAGNFAFATKAPNGSNFYVASINPPRTYGIRGGWTFGN
jgi:outer membrane receptor for ferrienterochelin and colicin